MSFKLSLGKTAITAEDMYTNEAIMAFIDKKIYSIDQNYIYHLFSGMDWLQGSNKAVMGVTLNKATLSQKTIDIPDIEEQHKVSKVLDKLDNLFSLRKQQLAKLDELVKARFVEMFGDLKQFVYKPLAENVEEMFIGPFGSSLKNDCFVSEEDGFCMVYEQKHAIRKTMNVETRYVEHKKYNELKRFTVFGGDIIVSCRGTIGKIYVVPDNAPLGIMHPSIMKIRLKESVYNKNYFVFALEQYMQKHNDDANGSGVKMAVTATTLGQERFAVPPMVLQQQFADFVTRIDRQKSTLQQSLNKLEVLKKSLMQKYFG